LICATLYLEQNMKRRSESSKTFKIANTDSGYLSTENGLRIELYAGTTGKIINQN